MTTTAWTSLVVFELAASEYALFSADVAAGTATATITSTDANDQIASFSSRGPTLYGALKPEVVAPGFDIPSTVPRHQKIPGNVYRLSGTSMATPYVAGTAAVVAALRPELDSATLRELVIGGAVRLDSTARDVSPSVQGAGRVKTETAADASVFASPATLGFGQADADKPRATLDFTLTNTSAAPVTAQLTVRPSASSQGTLTLSKDRVEIPAGASVTGTAAATAAIKDGETELSGEIEMAIERRVGGPDPLPAALPSLAGGGDPDLLHGAGDDRGHLAAPPRHRSDPEDHAAARAIVHGTDEGFRDAPRLLRGPDR